MTTGYVWEEIYAWHDTGMACSWHPSGLPAEPEPHVESPASKKRLASLIEVSGLSKSLVRLPAYPATRDDLLRFHTSEYIDKIQSLSCGSGGDGGEITPFGQGSYEIALLAVGGCFAAVDAVLNGKVDNAYALVRPPGHHAESDMGRGFCLFGNTALAAMYAQEVWDVERIAIIDWDVHHGNGTEHAFYNSSSVLTISIHQDNLYPNKSGAIGDIGTGQGEGFNINIPLPPGSGKGAYAASFERVIKPALKVFQPELIIVASGFDASAMDPLGRMILTAEDYRFLTRKVLSQAEKYCSGKVVMCHEGGYSSSYVPFCGLAVLEELSNHQTDFEDPFAESVETVGFRGLQTHQEDVIKQVEKRIMMSGLLNNTM